MSGEMVHPPRPRLTLSIGVIGHRPYRLPPAELARIEAEVERVISLIVHEVGVVKERYAEFFRADSPPPPSLCLVSGLAEGADSIVARVATSRGFLLDVPIPFLRDEYLRDFATEACPDLHHGHASPRAHFEAFAGEARSLLELPGERPREGCTDKRLAGKPYEMAGLTVIGQSDILLTVWDSGPSGGPGGTTDMLHQAVRRGVPIIEISTSDLCDTRIRWSSLRESPIAAEQIEELPAERFENVLPRLIEEFLRPPSAESERAALLTYLGVPSARWIDLAVASIEKLLGVPKRLCKSATSHAHTYQKLMRDISRDEMDPQNVSPTLLANAFGWADAVAIHSAKMFRFAYIVNFAASALAVCAALTSIFSEGNHWWPGIEIALIALVLGNTTIGRRVGWHQRWLEAREIAERMRVAILFWILGAQPPAFFGEEPAWTGWYARAIIREQGMRRGRLNLEGMSAARKAMLGVLRQQHKYHRDNARKMKRRENWLERIGQIFFGATLLIAVAHGWGARYFPDIHVYSQLLIVLSAVLPTIATACYGVRIIGDFEGIAKRSERTELDQMRVIEALLRDPSDLILFRARPGDRRCHARRCIQLAVVGRKSGAGDTWLVGGLRSRTRDSGRSPHGNLSYPSPSPFRLSGNPMPSSGVSKMINVAVLALRS